MYSTVWLLHGWCQVKGIYIYKDIITTQDKLSAGETRKRVGKVKVVKASSYI